MNDWEKYSKLLPVVRSSVKKKYSKLEIGLFDSLFYDSYDIAFIKFEKSSFDSTKGKEENYLTRITLNEFYDRHQEYEKEFGTRPQGNEKEVLDDIKNNHNNDLDFVLKQLLKEQNLQLNNVSKTLVKNVFIGWKMFRRRNFWLKKRKIEDDSLQLLSQTIYLSWDILNYRIGNVEFVEPLSVLRLKSWIRKDERKWMFNSLRLAWKSYDELNRAPNLSKPKMKYPILSAIALDSKGNYVDEAFKGEGGDWEKHCEYYLFKTKLNNNLDILMDGCLFVSLEPCSSRGVGKLPCAVWIAKSPVRTVYIGIVDLNENILQKGIEIIRSGVYTFKKSELTENGKESDGTRWLYSHFIAEREKSAESKEKVNIIMKDKLKRGIKRYSVVDENQDIISIAIGNFKIVKPFHRDIQLELLKLNRSFIEHHAPGRFVIKI